jgi:hypothetical protein
MTAWSRRISSILISSATAAGLADCSDQSAPQVSSATHFLEDCASTCLGGLECICGTCTRGCQQKAECADLTAQAICVLTSDAHRTCTGSAHARVCDVVCTSDADCDGIGNASRCIGGFCRSVAEATDAGSTPGSGGATGTPDGGTVGRNPSDGSAGAESSTGDGAACHAQVLYDPKNCGRCGHDCLGGTCASGICQPVVLALGQSIVDGIAADGDNVYWTSRLHGTINKASVTGGPSLPPITVLAKGRVGPSAIAIDATAVYWAEESSQGGVVASVSKTGGSVSTIATAQSRLGGVAVDAANVYWTTSEHQLGAGDGTVSRQPISGGTPFSISTDGGLAGPIGVDAENVYWADTNTWMLVKAPIVGGTPVRLAALANQSTFLGIVPFEGHVYYTTRDLGSVKRVTTSGTTDETIADGQDLPYKIAVDVSGIYWTNTGDSGTVMMIPRVGEQPVILAAGQGFPQSAGGGPTEIATDAHAVYWASGSGEIVKVAKP